MTDTGLRRLATGGFHIDRSRPLSFVYDGRPLSGYRGDTLASALLANGERLVGRSYKLHRPRGIIGAGPEEPNAYFQIGEGGGAAPNQRATEVLLGAGMVVRSQNRWPNLRFDIGEVSALFSRFLPAGFYYKTFIYPRAAWKAVYEPLIRHAAGMGRLPKARDTDHYEHFHLHQEVLVIGAGPAGLAAARQAALSGLRVMLVDLQAWPGGRLLGDDTVVNGQPGAEWAAAELATLAALPNVTVRMQTMAVALYDHNYVLLYEQPLDTTTPRRRLWRVRATQVVLATGALERPIVFANNDRPGIMLASAVRDYVRRWGVAPGSAAVVFTGNDDAYQTAFALQDAGVEVRCLVDARSATKGPRVGDAAARGIRIVHDSMVVGTSGRLGLQSVDIARLSGSGRPVSRQTIECNLLAVSGGWSPTVQLYGHAGGRLRWSEDDEMFVPDADQPPASFDGTSSVHVAGAANGLLQTHEAFESGTSAAMRALDCLGQGVRLRDATKPAIEAASEGAAKKLWVVPGVGRSALGDRHFVDYQHDVTVADLELAAREGYGAAELGKRYTTLGMAPDQGKISNVLGHGILADAAGQALSSTTTTTNRPPYSGFSIGAIVGSATGSVFRVVRETPMHDWHKAHFADFEPVGDWHRPYCYRIGKESRGEAVAREVLGTRGHVGLIDASTLGKLLVKGPDAGILLDRIYTNTMSSLKHGRCRYGLMCTDPGFLFDDGVVVRLDEETFLCHTTTGGSERVHGWLEFWLQTEWPELRVYTLNVTEQWAQFAVAGPRSRELLQAVSDEMDFSEDALRPLDFVEGTLNGVPLRAYGVSFSGALACEIAVPAGYGAALWEILLEAGRAYGLVTYGTEALHVMRAEKGFIMIGDETDGTVTPSDLGLDWAIARSEADFVGKRGMQMPHLCHPDREKLVGLLCEDPAIVLSDGACATENGRIIGHVTSSYWSPTLNRSIAMGLVQRGPERMGETLSFTGGENGNLRVRVVAPNFLDLPKIAVDQRQAAVDD